jgi:[ribosomal protein S18]-alanine N-acetyltransferase
MSMSENRPQVIVRPMSLNDIDEVLEIDKLAFPTPWPARTYRYEISSNDRSTMIVLESTQQSEQKNGKNGLGGWLRRFTGEPGHSGQLMGYGGMWHIADEAHISTIAIHPDWRGHRLGDLLIWCMVRRAIYQDARMVTLEVRVSNEVAQNLYRKYGFEIMGRRRGYYRDNGEDAYMMGIMTLDDNYKQWLKDTGGELGKILRVTNRVK